MTTRTSVRMFGFAAFMACGLACTAFGQTQPTPTTPTAPVTPTTPTTDTKTAAQPKAKVYDEAADAKKQIEAALAKAKKNNRRVLIQWGANWCGWCIKLDGLFKSDRDIAKELMYEYDLVHVDVGNFNKNIDLATSFGADLKAHGLPYLTVLGADGKAVTNQDTGELEKPADPKSEGLSGHDPAKVLEFLKKNQAAYPNAEDVLKDALTKAKTDNKLVFVHFGAPWCGWCHKLEDWMDGEKVSPLLAKAFVDCKIDLDRMKNPDPIVKQFGKSAETGIPWFCFVSPDGTKLVDSTAKSGNIGFPAEPKEIEHFKSMLSATKKLSDEDINTIAATLTPPPKPTAPTTTK